MRQKEFASGNIHGRLTSIDALLRKPPWLAGYRSIRNGEPFDYENARFPYEFGRQCAIVVRQVLGYLPPMPQGIDLVRPIYLQCRLDQTIPGDNSGLAKLRRADGRLDLDRYMREFSKQPPAASGAMDNLLGF